ncbi:MAG: hypothetical protein AB1Z23_04210 [Eubacteriales bacterium]
MSSKNRNTPEYNRDKRTNREPDRRSADRQGNPKHGAGDRISSSQIAAYSERTQKNIGRKKMSRQMRMEMIRMLIFAAIILIILFIVFLFVRSVAEKKSGFENPAGLNFADDYATQVPRDRYEESRAEQGEIVEPDPEKVRDISFGAKDIEFKERQINIPGIFDTEIVFSAGTGSLDNEVLTKLYLYNLDTQTEQLITSSKVGYQGEIYETYINHNWIVWLDTDKGKKNYIKVMNRGTGQIFTPRYTETGQPKLRLYGDTLVWMEQVSDKVDKLYMFDLNVQEDLTLFEFTDKATYGVSAPCIYENYIAWAGPGEDADTSGIYFLKLETNEQGLFSEPEKYFPGTYVHEPLYNGEVFVWQDTNKSRYGKLYIGRFGEEPTMIDQNITTYALGDGVVVYAKDSIIWAYVIETGEICRLTSPGESGMLPKVSKRTVVWYNLSSDSDKDVLRYKILTDEDLYPGGKP